MAEPVSVWRTSLAYVNAEEGRAERFWNDYRELKLSALRAKWPNVFPVRIPDDVVYDILGKMRKESGIPPKRPAVSAGAKRPRSRKKTAATAALPTPPRITPQSLESAFKPEKTPNIDAGMKALAEMLLPYIRAKILEDFSTSINLVKHAREN